MLFFIPSPLSFSSALGGRQQNHIRKRRAGFQIFLILFFAKNGGHSPRTPSAGHSPRTPSAGHPPPGSPWWGIPPPNPRSEPTPNLVARGPLRPLAVPSPPPRRPSQHHGLGKEDFAGVIGGVGLGAEVTVFRRVFADGKREFRTGRLLNHPLLGYHLEAGGLVGPDP